MEAGLIEFQNCHSLLCGYPGKTTAQQNSERKIFGTGFANCTAPFSWSSVLHTAIFEQFFSDLCQ